MGLNVGFKECLTKVKVNHVLISCNDLKIKLKPRTMAVYLGNKETYMGSRPQSSLVSPLCNFSIIQCKAIFGLFSNVYSG